MSCIDQSLRAVPGCCCDEKLRKGAARGAGRGRGEVWQQQPMRSCGPVCPQLTSSLSANKTNTCDIACDNIPTSLLLPSATGPLILQRLSTDVSLSRCLSHPPSRSQGFAANSLQSSRVTLQHCATSARPPALKSEQIRTPSSSWPQSLSTDT